MESQPSRRQPSRRPGEPSHVRPCRRRDHRAIRSGIFPALAGGGVVGALARYGLSSWLADSGGHFPLGTFVVNVSGSAALGILLAVSLELFPRATLARAALGAGVLGAYTTFSTFAVETVQLGRRDHWATAAVYVAGSVLAGLAASAAGTAAVRLAARSWRRTRVSR